MTKNLIEQYLDFYSETESPAIFYRWSIISGIGALLGRQAWVTHGHHQIFPNQYVMLVGDAGCRKSTAIKTTKKLIAATGYKTFVADKTTKEKLLLDLEEGLDAIHDPSNNLNVKKTNAKPTMIALFGEELSDDPKECYIVADEFNAFLGHSNLEFIDLLTNMWDYDGIYENRIKTGKSVRIPYPTFSLLGGNTPTGISQAFPTEVIGQGFFSRIMLIYSSPSDKRIPFPHPPDLEVYEKLVKFVREIKLNIVGEIHLEQSAKKALATIYHEWKDLEDTRFCSYSTRRFTHLLKLCTICAAAKLETKITSDTVLYANTILHYTESFMPKALGEFGKARNSDVTAKILNLLDQAQTPLDPAKGIWKHVQRDLDSRKQLGDILQGLQMAGKIQITSVGVTAKKSPPRFDFSYCQVDMLREWQNTNFIA